MATVTFIKQDSVRHLVDDLIAIGDTLEAEGHPLWFRVANVAASLASFTRSNVAPSPCEIRRHIAAAQRRKLEGTASMVSTK